MTTYHQLTRVPTGSGFLGEEGGGGKGLVWYRETTLYVKTSMNRKSAKQ
jgi:hypothetical protein